MPIFQRYTWGCSTSEMNPFIFTGCDLTFARTFLSHLSKINKMINFYQLFQDGQKQTRSNCAFPPPFVSLKLTKLLRQHAAETLLHCSMTETPFTKFDAQRIEFDCYPHQKKHLEMHPTPNGIFWILFADFGDFFYWEEWCSFHPVLWNVLGSPKKPRATFRVSLSPPTAVCTARSDPNSWQQNSFRGLPPKHRQSPEPSRKPWNFVVLVVMHFTNRWKMPDIVTPSLWWEISMFFAR